MNRKVFAILFAVILADLIALNVFAFAPGRKIAALPAAQPPAPIMSASVSSIAGSVTTLESTFGQIYRSVSPSVVAIRVVQKQSGEVPAIPEIPGFPFFGFPPGQQNRYVQAEGSGFVYNTSGDIVTNDHVVAGADRIAVIFADGTSTSGRVIGTDPNSDLAVVRVSAPSGLRPVQLADSTQVKVGQLAVAIGNPFGEQNTMTVGIVSAVGRALPAGNGNSGPTYTIPDVIQTDAPINPGNSGGVLLNSQGQVIGVTAAIESPVEASAGIGFAIPSAIVQRVIPALLSTGHYAQPWLGISGLTLNPDLAKSMGLQEGQRGALIVNVAPGGPAQRAGLRGSTRQVAIDGQQAPVGGDIIIAIDGRTVEGFESLVTYLARGTRVGQTITLTVLRDGRRENIQVTLAERPVPAQR